LELNEAFASVVLRYMQALDIPPRQDQRQRAVPSPWGIRLARQAQ
jgi:hypothetical protein